MQLGSEPTPFFLAEAERLIDRHSRHMLMASTVKNSRLFRVEAEAFVLNDLPGQSQKAFELFRVVAAEGQIVGVAGVGKSQFESQSVESIVKLACDLIA